MLARRKVLAFLGLGAAAAPLAAKAAADTLTAEMSGIARLGFGAGSSAGAYGGQPSATGGGSWAEKAASFFARNAIPDWAEDIFRERARYVNALDPDIANKRSWSFAVKVATQRQRNYETARRTLTEGARRSWLNQQFYERFGFWIS